MSFWILLQIILDIFLVAGVVVVWLRLSRPPKDDPRLSRGLQLLQSKISVLEDLSDRTENQVKQLMSLMEAKVKEIQQQILISDKQLQQIESSRDKSLEVAKIFQDRIPHQEIIERQNTIKYVKAARLAHQGLTVDEISSQVDLSKGEIEFITKVNRHELQFSEEALPEWAKEDVNNKSVLTAADVNQAPVGSAAFGKVQSDGFSVQKVEQTQIAQAIEPQLLPKENNRMTLEELGQKFRIAMQQTNDHATPAAAVEIPAEQKKQVQQPEFVTANNSKGQQVQVKKVIFPRMNTKDNEF